MAVVTDPQEANTTIEKEETLMLNNHTTTIMTHMTVAEIIGNEEPCMEVDPQELGKNIINLENHIITENQETIKDLACHLEDTEALLVTEVIEETEVTEVIEVIEVTEVTEVTEVIEVTEVTEVNHT